MRKARSRGFASWAANVAARLEGLAEAGGICLSEAIHQQVEAKLSVTFVDLGPQALKNIAKPVQAWALSASDIAKLPPVELAAPVAARMVA